MKRKGERARERIGEKGGGGEKLPVSAIPGFRRHVNEIFALPGCYAG